MAFVTELLGYIGLDVDEQSFDRAQFNITGMIMSLGGIIAAAGAVDATIKGLTFGLVNSFAETAVEIDQISKRLNIGAEGFQSMAYAASQYGIEQDAIVDGMKELSMRSAEFAQDGEANADAFGAIGISQAQVKQYGNNIEGLFELVRQKLSEVKEQGQRQFLADALFGGGLADVGGEFFSQTSAQIKMLQEQALDSGVIITDESIALSRQYTRDIGALTSRIKGLWQIIASNLLPVFSEAAKRLKEFLDLHGESIIDALSLAFRTLSEAVKYLGIAAAIAMPYLIGTTAIAGWTKLIALTNTLTGAFLTMRTGALLAWAAAAAGPVLLGLAIGLAIIAIQDLYGYFNGSESITELIVESFKKMDLSVRGIWDGLVDYIIGALGRIDKAIYNSMPEWLQETLSFLSGGMYNPNRNYRTQSNLQPDIPGHERIPGYAEVVRGENRQLDIPGHNVIAPPTMAQGMAQANAGRGNVITTNSGNTTVGEIIVNGAENPAATAHAIREELRRDNASRTKGTDTGVKY
jgi:hypothetical protein